MVYARDFGYLRESSGTCPRQPQRTAGAAPNGTSLML